MYKKTVTLQVHSKKPLHKICRSRIVKPTATSIQTFSMPKLSKEEKKVLTYFLKEASERKEAAQKRLNDKDWMSKVSLYDQKSTKATAERPVEETAYRLMLYLKSRSTFDTGDKRTWDRIAKPPNPNLAKETDDAYFYKKFPRNRFYIIRWLGSGGYHYYPRGDGELPEGFASRPAAERHVQEWHKGEATKIVAGSRANRYGVPKRY